MHKRSRYPFLFTRHKSPFLYFHWRDQRGIRHEQSTKKRKGEEKLADEIRIRFLDELSKGQLPAELNTATLSQAITSWLEHRRGRIAKGSLDSEKSITNRFLEFFGPASNLRDIAHITKVNEYESYRLDQGKESKTVNNEILVLKAMLERCDLWQRVALKYKKLKVKKSDVGACFTPDECRRLVKYAKLQSSTAVAPFAALVALGTGMRDWEIKGLKLGDLQLAGEKPCVYVRRENTKSDAGARYCALDPIATWALGRLLDRAVMLGSSSPEHHLLPTNLKAHTRPTDPLHGGKDFDPTHHQTGWEWDKVRRETGLAHRRFHDLRHTYVSRAAEAGISLAVLQAQVGHLTQSTLAIYIHISGTAQHDAAERIAAISVDLVSELNLEPVKKGGS